MAPVDVSVNHNSANFDGRLLYQNVSSADHEITKALAVQAESILFHLHHVANDQGILHYLLLISEKLRTEDGAIQSDIQGFSVVLATLLQNLINYSDQSHASLSEKLPTDTKDVITSYPIQWQLYGSGPRLAWQWVTVLVLVVVLGSFSFGIWQTVWYGVTPADCMEVPGMMVLAQRSDDSEDIDVKEKARKRLYFVDADGEGKPPLLWSKPFVPTM